LLPYVAIDILYRILLILKPYQFVHVDFQNLGDVHQRFEGGLAAVGAPFRDGCGVFVQLFGQPFIGPLLVGQYCFDSIQILCHRNVLFDYTGAKIVIIPLISCFKRIFLRKYMLFYGELHTFSIIISIFAV